MKIRTFFLAAALAACSHTKTVTPAADDKARPTAAKEPSSDPKGSVSRRNEAEGGTPVPRTPEGALAPGQLRRIQDRLAANGLLGEESAGTLDERTRKALREFQRSQNLPETGLPDQETVGRLGLNPDQVFARKQDSP